MESIEAKEHRSTGAEEYWSIKRTESNEIRYIKETIDSIKSIEHRAFFIVRYLSSC